MGEKVGGIAVHTGARVAAQAGPGEVLVSRTVVNLVAGSGLTFEDRGERQLVPGPGGCPPSRADWLAAGRIRGRVAGAAGHIQSAVICGRGMLLD
jgi:class 3 adenylate cyclase